MNETHNPDVLSCLANLSNDEVFTPPSVVNQMLDMLPQELFRSGKTTFFDIGCKSGVFLREITKRLIAGLADEMPDLQGRVDHILHKQVFGIATTELTSLVSRRTLYCSKYPNCRYSTSQFKTVEGNIRFRNIPHTFVNGRCKWCGASEDQFGPKARKGLETHAYEFIHTDHPEEIFKMKFDVIVGNPPYQLADGGNAASARPIYHLFVQQALKLSPRYLTMIIPARWYAGGKGLEDFRDLMLNSASITKLVDVANSNDCFPGVNIAGGVCYFLVQRDVKVDACEVSNFVIDKVKSVKHRKINEFSVFVRDNSAVEIIHKVLALGEACMDSTVYSRNSFMLASNERGHNNKRPNDLLLLSSDGSSWIAKSKVADRSRIVDKHKVCVTYAMSGGNKPGQDGKYQIFSSLNVLKPLQVCTETYLVLGAFNMSSLAQNMRTYCMTKFVRFLLLQALSSIHITKGCFCFVPVQDFSKPWTDAELYAKYKLTKDEIAFIESMIKPME